MAKLTTTDRERVWRGLMRYWSRIWDLVASDSDELLTTVNETDDWIDDNQADYKTSLTYGNNYTALQLTLLFCAVALMRVDPGIGDFLKRALGTEID